MASYPANNEAWTALYTMLLNRSVQLALHGETVIQDVDVDAYAANLDLKKISPPVETYLRSHVDSVVAWADGVVASPGAGPINESLKTIAEIIIVIASDVLDSMILDSDRLSKLK